MASPLHLLAKEEQRVKTRERIRQRFQPRLPRIQLETVCSRFQGYSQKSQPTGKCTETERIFNKNLLNEL